MAKPATAGAKTFSRAILLWSVADAGVDILRVTACPILRRQEAKNRIPSNIGLMTDLKVLLINNNRLMGAIPESITNLTDLELLYIHTNKLSGIIHENFCDLTSPGVLIRLEYNNFCPDPITGIYPDCDGKLNVGYQTCIPP